MDIVNALSVGASIAADVAILVNEAASLAGFVLSLIPV